MQKFCNFEEKHFGEDRFGKAHLTHMLMNHKEVKVLYGSRGVPYPSISDEELHWWKKSISDEEADAIIKFMTKN